MVVALRMGGNSFDEDDLAEAAPPFVATYPSEPQARDDDEAPIVAPAPPARDPAAPDVAEILKSAVDLLFPLLAPYEAVFYLYLLRRSVVETGEPYARVSVRKLMREVVRSARPRARDNGPDNRVSMPQVQKVLAALETLGAIRKESEPNRQGTLYCVMLPDEIPACRAAMAARCAAETRAVDVAAEADFYNVRENRLKIFARDGYRCRYCAKLLTRFTATLDHVTPVSAGGHHGADNLVTACHGCNSTKTGAALGDFLAHQRQG